MINFTGLKRVALVLLVVSFGGLSATASPAIASTHVYCEGHGAVSKPKSCEFYSRPGVAGTFIVKMHWHHWGGHKAVARGIVLGNMGTHSRVRVTLLNPRGCGSGHKVYTYVLFKTPGSQASGGRIVGCGGQTAPGASSTVYAQSSSRSTSTCMWVKNEGWSGGSKCREVARRFGRKVSRVTWRPTGLTARYSRNRGRWFCVAGQHGAQNDPYDIGDIVHGWVRGHKVKITRFT